jgi:hypothetical protein
VQAGVGVGAAGQERGIFQRAAAVAG